MALCNRILQFYITRGRVTELYKRIHSKITTYYINNMSHKRAELCIYKCVAVQRCNTLGERIHVGVTSRVNKIICLPPPSKTSSYPIVFSYIILSFFFFLLLAAVHLVRIFSLIFTHMHKNTCGMCIIVITDNNIIIIISYHYNIIGPFILYDIKHTLYTYVYVISRW